MKKKKRSIWRWLALVLVIAAIIAGSLYFYRSQATLAQEPAETPLQTATVRRGELVVSATGAGAVIPAEEVTLGFASGGLLSEVLVSVGDRVTAGDVLARVNDTSASTQVTQAELNLRQAELQLDKLLEDPTNSELAAAQATLAAAQSTLEDRQTPASAQEIAAAQQSLLSAQQKLTDLLDGPSAEDIASANADLELAAISVQQAQADYDKVSWRPEVGQLPQATALQEATLAYNKAKAVYDASLKGATDADITAARASISQAQATLESLQDGSTAQSIAAAQASVDQAQAQLELVAGRHVSHRSGAGADHRRSGQKLAGNGSTGVGRHSADRALCRNRAIGRRQRRRACRHGCHHHPGRSGAAAGRGLRGRV